MRIEYLFLILICKEIDCNATKKGHLSEVIK